MESLLPHAHALGKRERRKATLGALTAGCLRCHGTQYGRPPAGTCTPYVEKLPRARPVNHFALCLRYDGTQEAALAAARCVSTKQAASQLARLALALAAAQTVAHAESWAWQLLAHTPFITEPRTPLMLRRVHSTTYMHSSSEVCLWFRIIKQPPCAHGGGDGHLGRHG